MSKVDTDEGLGPGSERQREAVLKAQKDLESRTKQKAAAPASVAVAVTGAVDKNAVTEPGIGKVERKSDTVDDLLDGFGTERPNLPRILPNADTTPPPDPVRKELTPTTPGKRQRTRNMVIATIVTFAIVAAVGVALVKYGNASSTAATAPTGTTPTTTATSPATSPTETMAPITTTAIEALPTVKTSSPTATAPTATSTRTVHSATTGTTPPSTATPHPTGSAPPGMNLLPDDPHR